MAEERLIIIGVVHGQQSCMDEIDETVGREKPEIVAVELPPSFQDANLDEAGNYIDSITNGYKQLFENLELMGLSKEYSSGLEAVALGLSLQGVEFLHAIKAAERANARVEFIDIERDKLFWKLVIGTLKNLTRTPKETKPALHSEIEIFPGFNLPSFKIPTLEGISQIIINTINDWKKSLKDLMKIYSESDYPSLVKKLTPIMNNMNEYPGFKGILVDYRDEYMAKKLIDLLKHVKGKIVFVTGYGHVEGVKKRVKKGLEQEHVDQG